MRQTILEAGRHLDPNEGSFHVGQVITSADMAAIRVLLDELLWYDSVFVKVQYDQCGCLGSLLAKL